MTPFSVLMSLYSLLLNGGCRLPRKLLKVNRWDEPAFAAGDISCLPLVERRDTARFIVHTTPLFTQAGWCNDNGGDGVRGVSGDFSSRPPAYDVSVSSKCPITTILAFWQFDQKLYWKTGAGRSINETIIYCYGSALSKSGSICALSDRDEYNVFESNNSGPDLPELGSDDGLWKGC